MRTIDIESWRGPRDPVPLDPSTMCFRAQRADSCRGCLFDGQWSAVCKRASAESVSRGGADCDNGFIYVATEVDPRQMTLESGPVPAATDASPDQSKT